MLDKQIKKKVLRRAVTDLTPGKSLWKNVTTAVTAFKKGSYVGCYPQPPNAGEDEFQKYEGAYPRESIILDLIQLRSPSPGSNSNDEKIRKSLRKKSLDILDLSSRKEKKNGFEYRKLSIDENCLSSDENLFEHLKNDKDSPTITPTATYFSSDDLDEIFNVGRKTTDKSSDNKDTNKQKTIEIDKDPLIIPVSADEQMDSAMESLTTPVSHHFSHKMITSQSDSALRPSTLDLSDDHANESSGILNPRTPFSPITPDGKTISPIQMVCREIFMTEKTYVNDLQEVIEGYIYHLKQQSDKVESIFGNLETIYEFNKEVLYQIEQCETEDNELDPVAMANVFSEKARGFNHHYTQYCTNYPEASSFFAIIMQDPGIAKFFNERQKVIGHALPLESYLLKPVQRIMKYHLLFRDILKRYEGPEKGFNAINNAVTAMTDVAEYINEMKRLHENAIKVQEILTNIIDLNVPIDIFETGRLVLENTFKVQGSRGDRLMYLFEKLLLICKKTEEKCLMFKEKIECSNMMLVESISKDPLGFQILRFDNQKVNYTIIAKTQEVKREWVQHLKRLILENHAAKIPQTARQAILGPEEKAKSKYMSLPMNALDNQYIRNLKAKTLPRSSHVASYGKENVPAGVKRGSNEKDASGNAKRTLNTKAKEYLHDKRHRNVPSPISSSSPDKEKKEKNRWIRRHKQKPSLDGTLLLGSSMDEPNEKKLKSRSLESLKDSIRKHDDELDQEDQVLKDIINSNFGSLENDTPIDSSGKRSRPTSMAEAEGICDSVLAGKTEHVNKILKENNDHPAAHNTTNIHKSKPKSASMVLPTTRTSKTTNSFDGNDNDDSKRWSDLSQDSDTIEVLERRLSLLTDDDSSSASIKNMVRKVSNAFNKSYQAYDDPLTSTANKTCDVSRDLHLIFGKTSTLETPENKTKYRRSTGGLMSSSIFIPAIGRSRSELSVFQDNQEKNKSVMHKDIENNRETSNSMDPISSVNAVVREDEKTEWSENVDHVFDEVNAELDSLADSIADSDTTFKSQQSDLSPNDDLPRTIGMDINERAAFVDQRLREVNDDQSSTSPNSSRKINYEVKRVADRIKEYKKLIDAEKRMKSWRVREPKTMNEMMESLDSINTANTNLSPVYSSYRRRFRLSRDNSSSDTPSLITNGSIVRRFSESYNSDKTHSDNDGNTNNKDNEDNTSDTESAQIISESMATLEKLTGKRPKSLEANQDMSIENGTETTEFSNRPLKESVTLCTSIEWVNKSSTLPPPKRINAVKRNMKNTNFEVVTENEKDSQNEFWNNENSDSYDSDKENNNGPEKESVKRVNSDPNPNKNPRRGRVGPPVREKPTKFGRSVSVPSSRRRAHDRAYSHKYRYDQRKDSSDSQEEKGAGPERGRSSTVKLSVNSGKYISLLKDNKKEKDSRTQDKTSKEEKPTIRNIRCTSLPRRSRKNLLIPSYIKTEDKECSRNAVSRSPSIRCIQQNHVNNRIKEYFVNLERSSTISQSRPNLVIVGSYSSGSDDTDNDNTSSSDGRISPSFNNNNNNNTDHILKGTVRSMIKRYGSTNYVFDT